MAQPQHLALAKPGLYEPEWSLDTSWFTSRGIVGNSFLRQAGIRSRRIAELDEVEMAARAVEALKGETGLELSNCAGLILASASLAESMPDTNPQLALQQRWPDVDEAANRLTERLGLQLSSDCCVIGMNWHCSAFPRALERCAELNLARKLRRGEYYLIVTSNRLSERADFGDKEAAVFGDYATATPIVNLDDNRHEKLLHLLFARAQTRPVGELGFTYTERPEVLYPTREGGEVRRAGDVVFQMNGPAIAGNAPYILAESAAEGLAAMNWANNGVTEWLHHQAGAFITRYFRQFLQNEGIAGRVNETIEDIGNLSSSSIPQLMASRWVELTGRIGLPAVGAGTPGKAEMTKGVAMLEVWEPHA